MKPVGVDNRPRAGDKVDACDRGIVKGPVGEPIVVVVLSGPSGAAQIVDQLIDKISV